MAQIIAYPPVVSPRPAAALPFVSGDPLRVGNCWKVDADSIPEGLGAFKAGELLAAHYLAFLRDGNGTALPGGLMQIVSSMGKNGALDKRHAGDGESIAAGFMATIDASLRVAIRTTEPEQFIAHHPSEITRKAA